MLDLEVRFTCLSGQMIVVAGVGRIDLPPSLGGSQGKLYVMGKCLQKWAPSRPPQTQASNTRPTLSLRCTVCRGMCSSEHHGKAL